LFHLGTQVCGSLLVRCNARVDDGLALLNLGETFVSVPAASPKQRYAYDKRQQFGGT
jgi:hypothetical protein